MRSRSRSSIATPGSSEQRAEGRAGEVAVVDEVPDGIVTRDPKRDLVAVVERSQLAVLVDVVPRAARRCGEAQQGAPVVHGQLIGDLAVGARHALVRFIEDHEASASGNLHCPVGVGRGQQ